jgi:hypothetical protein
VSRWEFLSITFNDRSTKVYVLVWMEMGFEDVALLTAGNLTHMEREKRGDTSGRSRKKKRAITRLPGSFIMHAMNSSWPTGREREYKSRRLGDQHQWAFLGFACPRGNSGRPGQFSIPRQPNGPKTFQATGWFVTKVYNQPLRTAGSRMRCGVLWNTGCGRGLRFSDGRADF